MHMHNLVYKLLYINKLDPKILLMTGLVYKRNITNIHPEVQLSSESIIPKYI